MSRSVSPPTLDEIRGLASHSSHDRTLTPHERQLYMLVAYLAQHVARIEAALHHHDERAP